MNRKSVLLLTDFSYQAGGREYFKEDVELSVFLRKHFNVYISHLSDVEYGPLNIFDILLIRNTGPQNTHEKQLDALRKRSDLVKYNDLSGKGDTIGKQHLLDLYKEGFPVIPTFQSKQEYIESGLSQKCLLKPLNGADSCGVMITDVESLSDNCTQNYIIQPLMDFQYEVSFYFVDQEFHYALYAPNLQKRWELRPYEASQDDIDFALKFIDWNTCKLGIQRVDACRLRDGALLLMELEDYNPFLSLDLVPDVIKTKFLESLCNSLLCLG